MREKPRPAFGLRNAPKEKPPTYSHIKEPGYKMAAKMDEDVRDAWNRLEALRAGDTVDKVTRDAIEKTEAEVASAFEKYLKKMEGKQTYHL